MRKLLFWLILVPVLLALLVQLYFFLQIGWWVNHNPESTSFMRQQLSTLQEKNPNAQLKQKWVPYKRISNNLKRAIIASEDSNFPVMKASIGTRWKKLTKKRSRRARLLLVVRPSRSNWQRTFFLSGDRSYIRKAQEFVITWMLEFWMDKERIFEIYLNVVEWGVGIFGAEAAAQHYYGISAAQLSAEQAARLAVMLPKSPLLRCASRHRLSGPSHRSDIASHERRYLCLKLSCSSFAANINGCSPQFIERLSTILPMRSSCPADDRFHA